MFNNEQMADVHFIVGPPGETQRVPAHKVPGLDYTWTHLNSTVCLLCCGRSTAVGHEVCPDVLSSYVVLRPLCRVWLRLFLIGSLFLL